MAWEPAFLRPLSRKEVSIVVEASSAEVVRNRPRGTFVPFVVFFAALSTIALLLAFPLLRPLAWSLILSFFSYPLFQLLHVRIFRGRFSNVAAGLTTALIIAMLLLPAILFVFYLAHDGMALYGRLTVFMEKLEKQDISFIFGLIPNQFRQFLDPWLSQISLVNDLFRQLGGWFSGWIANVSRGIFESAFRLVFQLIVITVSSFFMIRDGHVIVEYIRDIVPLSAEETDAMLSRGRRMLQAVVYGFTFTAAVQGFLGALGWWWVGLPNAFLFGALMFIFAIIPFVGTALVWVPGAIYLLASGQQGAALTLAFWGIAIVSTVDNFLRPVFISEGSKVHILIVFIGVVGGLATLGFLGIFLGPLVMTLFFFSLDAYRSIWLSLRQSAPTGKTGP
jgi:predicted PurR-regulated permease PerM